MALQLTPPKKNVFYFSVILALVAFLLYVLGVFGVFEGGFQAVSHYAFWIAMVAWLVMTAGVAAKGV